MNKRRPESHLVLDRKGEYVRDVQDQHGNSVPGMHHHPMAPRCMVVVSDSEDIVGLARERRIRDQLPLRFNITDIDPTDLADFFPGFTPRQRELVGSYAYVPDFYQKLFAERRFGQVDKSRWFHHFPGLYGLSSKGKKLLHEFETNAAEDADDLTDEQRGELQDHLDDRQADVLERAVGLLKRACLNPLFGATSHPLQTPSSLQAIIRYLEAGHFVYLDMHDKTDDEYTLVAALLARKLLRINKQRTDDEQIRCCFTFEEAHNILSEAELKKGEGGRGSVFIELAREGRSRKLGFVLVTQQPDPRSIAPQIAKTIQTVVALQMPPQDARYLENLKSGFANVTLAVSSADTFDGVAIAAGGPVFFRSGPVDESYMRDCADGRTPQHPQPEGMTKPANPPKATPEPDTMPALTVAERLAELAQRRRDTIRPFALDAMRMWQRDADRPVPTSPAAPRQDIDGEPAF